MNKLYIFLFGLVIGAGTQAGVAAEITDTYATGDTLTAAKLNNIKSAVNENHTVINALNLNQNALRDRFGGDGSAGDLTISSDVDWSITPPANPNFNTITILAGQTLTVPAGTTIRAKGNISIEPSATLRVLPGAKMAGHGSLPFTLVTPDMYSIGHPGDSFRPASGGAFHIDALATPLIVQGGIGGEGIPVVTATTSFNNFRIGGGSGSGWIDSGASSGAGGGLVRIYSGGVIINRGIIEALGEPGTQGNNFIGGFGGGGGGGGIVIMAAASIIGDGAGFEIGTINVSGGRGGNANVHGGAGGGGGGGIIVMVAPVVALNGTSTVSGGAAGSASFLLQNNIIRIGGGAGGGSGGSGGNGSNIPSAASTLPDPAGPGQPGYVIGIEADPSVMMN